MRRLSGALALVGYVLLACTTQGATPNKRTPLRPPNVLIIVTDDQRARHTLQAMPATTRLFAREGTRFSQAFVTTPLCCPSRASIFTGMYVHNHGVLRNELGRRLPHRATLQRYLHDEGYKTGIVGKYIQGVTLKFDPRYFDEWDTFSWGYYQRYFNIDGELHLIHRYSTDHVSAAARKMLAQFEKSDSDPWFLYVAPSSPHKPYTPELKYAEASVPPLKLGPAVDEHNRSDKPAHVQRSVFPRAQGRMILQQQLRSLKSVDDMVARLFRRMRELDESRNTLAFYLSDNGFLLGEHGLFAKRLPYDASIQIPLLMRWPGHVERGVVRRAMAANIDVLPTVLDAVGIASDVVRPVDGTSLLDHHTRDRLLIEQPESWPHGIPDWASIRTPAYQYIEYYSRDGRSVIFREYYDLADDPWQLDNLLGDGDPSNDPDIEALSAQLRQDRRCVGLGCP